MKQSGYTSLHASQDNVLSTVLLAIYQLPVKATYGTHVLKHEEDLCRILSPSTL